MRNWVWRDKERRDRAVDTSLIPQPVREILSQYSGFRCIEVHTLIVQSSQGKGIAVSLPCFITAGTAVKFRVGVYPPDKASKS